MRKATQEKTKLARSEAVLRLGELTRQLEEGTIRVGERSFEVPEEIRLELKASEGEIEIELEWKAPAVGKQSDAERAAREGYESTLGPEGI